MARTSTILLALCLCPLAAVGMPLLGGQYKTVTDVEGILNLALDAAEIKEANSTSLKTAIYHNGTNGYMLDSLGKRIELSYASLSLSAGSTMQDDMIYNLFMHSFNYMGQQFGEKENSFAGHPIEQYADAIVSNLFHLFLPDIEVDAILILHVWMATVHEMWSVYQHCSNQDPGQSLAALDRAAAFWIGTDQEAESSASGHSLYNLAEEAGQRFVHQRDETKVNSRILKSLNNMQAILQNSQACKAPSMHERMRNDVLDLVGIMSVPLVQNFIHYLIHKEDEDMTDFLNLYALALMPRILACDQRIYEEQFNIGMLNTLDHDGKGDIIEALQQTYTCFRIKCSDVGSYMDDAVPQCSNEQRDVTLAGYTSNRKDFLATAQIDRDVKYIGMMVGLGKPDLALDLYRFGFNSKRSLKEMSKQTSSISIPQFIAYEALFDSHLLQTADTMIESALLQQTPFESMSMHQLSEVVIGLSVDIILHLSIVTSMFAAVEECWNYEEDSSLEFWDAAVALYTGSLEGSVNEGSNFGELMFTTSKELCKVFETCTDDLEQRQSKVNQHLLSTFTDTSILLAQSECGATRKSIIEFILPSLLVPLFQGCIAYASILGGISTDSTDGAGGAAHAFAISILPILEAVDPISADVVDKNLVWQNTELLILDGFPIIINSLRSAVNQLPINCTDIGNWEWDPDTSMCEMLASVETDEPGVESMPPTILLDQQALEGVDERNVTSDAPSEIPSDFPSLVPTLSHAETEEESSQHPVAAVPDSNNIFDKTTSEPTPSPFSSTSPSTLSKVDSTKSQPPATSPTYVTTTAAASSFPSIEASSGPSMYVKTSIPTADDGPLYQVTPEDDPSLDFGRYSFSNEVVADGFASFALDLRDMLAATGPEEALSVYADGHNAIATGFPNEVSFHSLSALSVHAFIYMEEDPMFNIFKFALYDESAFDSGNSFAYADEAVRVSLSQDQALAAEAALALNVWMMIAHKLHAAIQVCSEGKTSQMYIDAAAALWIGKGQKEDSADGWMFYALAQKASTIFGYTDAEAKVNTDLITEFNDLQHLAGACASTDADLTFLMRLKVQNVLRLLSIPLLQLFFHSVAVNDIQRVELYSTSLFPQVSVCSKSALDQLSQALFSEYSSAKLTKKVIASVQYFLQCTGITCEDIETSPNSNVGLKMLVNQVCGESAETLGADLEASNITIVTATTAWSTIEMDVKRLDVFLQTTAYGTALDCYEEGYNSVLSNATFLTIRDLAMNPSRRNVSSFDSYATYFKSDDYVDDLVMDLLHRRGDFSNVSRRNLADMAVKIFQSVIAPMAVLGKMESAVLSCRAGEIDDAMEIWDSALHVFTGSSGMNHIAEHSNGDGGDNFVPSEGVSTYSLADEFCSSFKTCDETSMRSKVNLAFLRHHNEGRALLSAQECDSLEILLDSDITRRMQIPLVQGTLHYAAMLDVSKISVVDEPSKQAISALGYVLSRSILPLVNAVNQTSASIIENAFQSATFTDFIDATDVFDAFRYSLYAMSIDCKDIGLYHDSRFASACLVDGGQSNETASADSPPASNTTEVYLITHDLKTMEIALSNRDIDGAMTIYQHGNHGTNSSGWYSSLQGLSTEETAYMVNDPLFLKYLYAIGGSRENIDIRRSFADKFVQNSFSSAEDPTIVSEATALLNVWMYISHLLHRVVEACSTKDGTDNNPSIALADAIALWNGEAFSSAGDSTRQSRGLLYEMSEQLGFFFHVTDAPDTNTAVMDLSTKAQQLVQSTDNCASVERLPEIHDVLNKMQSTMAIPIVQGLIHSLRTGGMERTKLYGYAFVPLVASCGQTDFEYLKDKLLDLTYEENDVDKIIETVQKLLPCIGLSCQQIGTHVVSNSVYVDRLECLDADAMSAMAGYRPVNNVRMLSYLDADIADMDMLIHMGAYQAASNVYHLGKHAPLLAHGDVHIPVRSLNHLIGDTSKLNVVPHYTAFVNYFQSGDYMNQMIWAALDDSGNNNDRTIAQRKEMVVRTVQTQITYFGALQRLYGSVEHCKAGTAVASELMKAWDEAAALLIGHMEGPSGSATDGYFWYHLSQEFCEEFGTCNASNTSNIAFPKLISESFLNVLGSGRSAAKIKSCDGLHRTVTQLNTILLIPMIQGTLKSSVEISNILAAGGEEASERLDIAKVRAHIFSRTLLPVIRAVDPSMSALIDHTLDMTHKGMNVVRPTTGRHMFFAFSTIYKGLGIDCKRIGKLGELDACHSTKDTVVMPTEEILDDANDRSTFLKNGPNGIFGDTKRAWMWWICICGGAILITSVCIIFYRRYSIRRGRKYRQRSRKQGTMMPTSLSQDMALGRPRNISSSNSISRSYRLKKKTSNIGLLLMKPSNSSESTRLMSEIEYGGEAVKSRKVDDFDADHSVDNTMASLSSREEDSINKL